MKIVIIIPTYNEKENIENTINTLQKTFQKVPSGAEMHILVTDGNSPDGTGEIVQNISKNSPNVHLTKEVEKSGIGAAYKGAMDKAFREMNADAVITFDADLSHDPEKLPIFVEKLQNGSKYVCGSRYTEGGGIPEEWGLHRKLLSSSGNRFVRILYMGSGCTDFTSGYKAISKEVYEKIGEKVGKHSGYTFAIATNLEAVRAGYKIDEVPYHFKDRTMGKSKMGSEYILNGLIFVVQSRVKDFFNSRFGKVFVAGGLGSVAQFITYGLIFKPLVEVQNIFGLPTDSEIWGFDVHPNALFALLLAIEMGVLTAFCVNNLWAFKDSKLTGFLFWKRFAKNQLVVAGGILIQLGMFQALINLFGRGDILDYVYQILGILVGLFWNFYFYQKIIWKTKN
jgi:dolichol-phosphate mannosyltransferase